MSPGVAKPCGPQGMQKTILQLTAKNRSSAGTAAERASASNLQPASAGSLAPASNRPPPPKKNPNRKKREERKEPRLNCFANPDSDDEWGGVMSGGTERGAAGGEGFGADDKSRRSLNGTRTNVRGDPDRK